MLNGLRTAGLENQLAGRLPKSSLATRDSNGSRGGMHFHPSTTAHKAAKTDRMFSSDGCSMRRLLLVTREVGLLNLSTPRGGSLFSTVRGNLHTRRWWLLAVLAASLTMSAAVRISVLTRDAHRGGSWITSLVRALQERMSKGSVVQVYSVELAESDRTLLPPRGAPQCDLLVNRVSDAAPPATAKKAAAILRVCELHGIPVINGAHCFGVGNNKMMHHQVLSAGVRAQWTVVCCGLWANLASGGRPRSAR